MAILCLLCACIHAQTAGTSSSANSSDSSSQSQTSSADPSQQPTSPLQEAPKEQLPQDVNKPKAASFDTAGGSVGQDQILGEIRLMTRYTELNGDTTRSFRDQGHNNLGEFNLFVDRQFFVTRRYQMLSMYRATDDHSIDPERNSLQKAYVRIFGAKDEYVFGDALVNYSRLSFNQNIKGASVTSKIGEDWKVSSSAGIFIDRWGSLYKELTGKPYTSAVAGARVERSLFNRESKLGFNFSSSRDLVDSIDQIDPVTGTPFAVGTAPLPGNNLVNSIDLKFQSKKGFRFDSEYAYSFTDFDKRFEALGCAAPCDTRVNQPALNRNQGDWGFRAEGSYRYKRASFRGSFVRFQPNFASINARQIADLQDLVFRTSYDLTEWLTVDGTIRRSNDDLKGQLPFQTTLWGPEGKLIFHDLPFYSRAVFELGYRHRNVSASDGSVDRFIRTPYAELSIPIKQMFLTFGYERRQAIDQIDARQTSNTDRGYVGLRGIWDIGNWQINPSLRYELERQTHRPAICEFPTPVLPATVNPPGTLCSLLIDPRQLHDSNRLGSAALFIEAPKWFVFEGAFRSSSATLTSLAAGVDPVTLAVLPPPYIPSPNGFSRPTYRAALTYKYRNDENMTFTFGFERNNNFYFTSPNYDERMWSGTILYRFGRRAQ